MTASTFAALVAGSLFAMALVMTGAWSVQQRTGNSGWVDTIWTLGVAAVAIALALSPLARETPGARQWMVAALIAIWALRLGGHIARRTAAVHDDPRYAKLRRDWGDDAPRRMFWLLQTQALVSVPLVAAVVLAAQRPGAGLELQDLVGALILVAGIAGEAIADRQLRGFAATQKNRSRVCDVGLWRWSRHPNYFFEWFGWLAYPVMAIDLHGTYAWGWFALAGPACMYWLLVYVSGIPPLEEHMLATRGDAYRAYRARTSAFFPLPPAVASEHTT